jgi:hypothetical protein
MVTPYRKPCPLKHSQPLMNPDLSLWTQKFLESFVSKYNSFSRYSSKLLVVCKRSVWYQYRSCLTTGWTIGLSRFDPRQGQIFLLAPASRPALGPTEPPIQWVPGVLSPGVKRGRGVTLTTHPHLASRLRMSRSYTSSPPMCLHGV